MHNSVDRPVPSLVSDAPVDSGKLPSSSVGSPESTPHASHHARHHITSIQNCDAQKSSIANSKPKHCASRVRCQYLC